MTPLKIGSPTIVQEELTKLRLLDLKEDKKSAYDGRIEWRPTGTTVTSIQQFRTAVLISDEDVIKQTLGELQDVTAVRLFELLASCKVIN